jgi:5'-nucleotidase
MFILISPEAMGHPPNDKKTRKTPPAPTPRPIPEPQKERFWRHSMTNLYPSVEIRINVSNPPHWRLRFAAMRPFFVPLAALAALLAGCAAPPSNPVRELSILSFNDFHGNIQAQGPVPVSPRLPDPRTGELKTQPAGGAAYFASAMQQLRARNPNTLIVAGGDLIGASPQMSSLLRDEPTLAALSELGVTATALGNHELDAGLPELLRKARGECAPQGCAWPGYKGPGFPYLAANMIDEASGKPALPGHVLTEVGGLRIGIAGAVTRDTPKVIVARAIQGLRFTDEADALNAEIPSMKAAGARLLVAIMHEGGAQSGPGAAANDPSYACPGLSGRVLDIAKRLDPAYAVIIGGHTHQAYTCKIDGRLVVQAGSYGGWITESRLQLDGDARVLDAQAINHPVLQSAYAANPALAALVARAAELTAAARNRPVATLKAGATRHVSEPNGDSALGNLIADAQLAYARKQGPADIAFMNPGGIRADLVITPERPVTMSDLLAIQPFGNDLVALTLSGQQLLDLLQRQLPHPDSGPRLLSASAGLRYTWNVDSDGQARLGPVSLDGQPLQPGKDYRIVVNNFLSEGGDASGGFRLGRNRAILGSDIDALVDYLSGHPDAVATAAAGRLTQSPKN